jgi:hypothetical protein
MIDARIEAKLAGLQVHPEFGPEMVDSMEQFGDKFHDQVAGVVHFLAGVPQRVNVNRRVGSYGWKHIAEKRVPGGYVCEAAFVAGAIIAGFRAKFVRTGVRSDMEAPKYTAYFNLPNVTWFRRRDAAPYECPF